MLNKLFSSKTRVKLLKLFLFNPEKKFFVRELTRILNEHLNSIRRELSNLEEMGLIECVDEEKGKKNNKKVDGDFSELKISKNSSNSKIQKKYYQVNQNFSLFKELKALFLRAEVISEEEVKNMVDKISGVEYFILTGSFTNSSSPTDILVVGSFDQNKLISVINDLERMINKELNYTVMDKEEFLHRLNLVDKFLYKILECNKIIIKDNVSTELNPYLSENLVSKK